MSDSINIKDEGNASDKIQLVKTKEAGVTPASIKS